MEKRFRPWREKTWQLVYGPRVLEVGVGTGKNRLLAQKHLCYSCRLMPGMLEIARQRASRSGRQDDDLSLADIQQLELPSGIFNTVVATFVFCSVPDPIQGLREIGRVVHPDGHILLLEHVRIDRPVIDLLMDMLAPFIARFNGAGINRRTVENVWVAGLESIKSWISTRWACSN